MKLTPMPAGIRLDAWPETVPSKTPEDSREVAGLRQELRKSMPQMIGILEVLSKVQPMRDLAARLAGVDTGQERKWLRQCVGESES